MTRLIEADEPPHPVVAQALGQADEILADAHVASSSEAAGRSIGELRLHTNIGMEVLAIRRGPRWLYRPRGSRQIAAGDRLLVLGPHEGVGRLRDLCGDERHPDQLVAGPDTGD